MRMDPFSPGVEMAARLRELEAARRTRKRDPVSTKGGVQIAESSILYKEDQKYVVPALPFVRYDVADAYLFLIVGMVSSNSLLGVSAVRAIWKLLTGEFDIFGLLRTVDIVVHA